MNFLNSLKKYNSLIFLLIFSLVGVLPLSADDKEQKNEEKILLGMSTALSGPAKNLGNGMLSGVKLGFKHSLKDKNAYDPIDIIALDDKYEPRLTIPNMMELINQKEVLAILGNVGTPTAIASVPIANQNKILLYGCFTGAGILRKTPPDRYIYNFRASYEQEISSMIDALIKIKKLKIEDIAFFTQRDGYGDAGFSAGIKALSKYGLKDPYQIVHTRYQRNSLAVESAVAELLTADRKPKAVIMVCTYAPGAKFIRLMKENGLSPIFLNVSFVGSESLAKLLGDDGEGVIITQVVPHYFSDIPIAQEYINDKKTFHNSEQNPSFVEFEGYIIARIFTKILEKTERPLTREKIIETLESFGEFNIGLESLLKFNKDHHQASSTVWPMIIHKGKIESFKWENLTP